MAMLRLRIGYILLLLLLLLLLSEDMALGIPPPLSLSETDIEAISMLSSAETNETSNVLSYV